MTAALVAGRCLININNETDSSRSNGQIYFLSVNIHLRYFGPCLQHTHATASFEKQPSVLSKKEIQYGQYY